MTEKEIKQLISTALDALKNSYAPYSNFNVGAALLTSKNKVYSGCNIENAAYSSTICAERTAIFSAVNEGEKNFKAIAIVGGHRGNCSDFCSPCGVCRQVMTEFCGDDFLVIFGDKNLNYKTYTLDQLLPHAFKRED